MVPNKQTQALLTELKKRLVKGKYKMIILLDLKTLFRPQLSLICEKLCHPVMICTKKIELHTMLWKKSNTLINQGK